MEDGIDDIAAEPGVDLPEPPPLFEAEPAFDPGPPDVGAPHEGAVGAPPAPPALDLDPVEPPMPPTDGGGGGGMVPPGQPGGAGGPDPIDITDSPPDVGAPHEGAPPAAAPPGAPAVTDTLTAPPPPPMDLPVTLGTESVIAAGQPGGPPLPTIEEPGDDDGEGQPAPTDEPEPIIRLVPAEPPEGTSLITDDALAELRLDAARGRRGQLEELIQRRDGGSASAAAPVRTIVRVVAPEEAAAAPVAGLAAAAEVPDDAHLDLDGVERLFDRMGLDTSRVGDAGLPDLLAALEDGRGVAIGATDENGVTRALMITGIDVDRGIVFAFEPPDGELIELPLDDVLAEWAEAGNEMLLVDEAATSGDGDGDAPAGDGALTRAGFAVLPITLGAGALAAAKAVRARRASS